MDESAFVEKLNEWLLPSSPIRRIELLRGRKTQLDQTLDALDVPGRHVFVFGDRGVGKTSLAQVAGILHQSAEAHPLFLACDARSTVFELVREMTTRLVGNSPLTEKSVKKVSAKLNWSVFDAATAREIHEGRVPVPKSVNEAVSLIRYGAAVHSKVPVLVVDEFDRLPSDDERALFGDLLKQLADQDIGVKLLITGVGRSLDELLSGHESSFRYLAGVQLDRLGISPLIEILDGAAQAVGVAVRDDFQIRTACISDGFPHYSHLLGRKMLLRAFRAGRNEVSAEDFADAVADAVQDVEPYLAKAYKQATEKYNDDYKYVLWAAADHYELTRRSRDIYDSLDTVTDQLNIEQMDRTKFNNRLNSLKQESHGAVLTGTRQGWYEFTEPMLRGFCRLRAEAEGVQLGAEYLERRPRT